jgi:carbonic anhydrase/acetyltransferase-like protein (isoleucine patch superfamily)
MLRAFGDHLPELAKDVYVDETALVMGQVQIGSGSSVWPMAVLRGDVNRITVGEKTNIQDGTIVHVTHDGPFTPGGFDTVIGDHVTIGHRAIIHACRIGDRCLIGMGAIIMDGAELQHEVILAAGALVPPGKVLQSGYLYVGSPVKQVRPLTEKEKQHLSYSADYYATLALQHT